MARKPMVTRTIVTTKVNVLCLDIKSAEPFNKVVTLPRTYKDEKQLLKKVEEIVNTDEVKAVHVVGKEEVETLYGMSEQDFINNAVVLDNETRRPIGETGTDEEQMDEDELRYCHHDDTDEYHACLDYMECEECPYYYADVDQVTKQ